jgi:hypothetical protein
MIDRWSKELATSGNSSLQLQQQSQVLVPLSGASETMSQVLVQLVQAIKDAAQKVLLALPSFDFPNVNLTIKKFGETARRLFYTELTRVGL